MAVRVISVFGLISNRWSFTIAGVNNHGVIHTYIYRTRFWRKGYVDSRVSEFIAVRHTPCRNISYLQRESNAMPQLSVSISSPLYLRGMRQQFAQHLTLSRNYNSLDLPGSAEWVSRVTARYFTNRGDHLARANFATGQTRGRKLGRI